MSSNQNNDSEVSLSEQEKNKKKYEAQIDSMLEKSDQLANENKYDDAISILQNALGIVEKNPWGIIVFKIKDLIENMQIRKNNYLKEKEKKEKLEKIEKEKKEKEARLASARERLKKKEQQKKEEILRQLQEKKKKEEEISNQALNLLEKGTKYAQQENYDEAIENYLKAKQLFLSIKWDSEAAKIDESIENFNQKKKELQTMQDKLKEPKSVELSETELKYKTEHKEYIKEIELGKKKADELKKKQMEQQKKQEQALNLIDVANDFRKKELYGNAIETYEQVISIFKEIGWDSEVERIQNIIKEIIKEKEQKDKLVQNVQVLEDKKKLEKEALSLLDKAEKARQQKQFNEAISFLEQAKENFLNIDWKNEAEKIVANIKELKEEKERYLKAIEEKKKFGEEERRKMEEEAQSLIDKAIDFKKEKKYKEAIRTLYDAKEIYAKTSNNDKIDFVKNLIEETNKEVKEFFSTLGKKKQEQERIRKEKEIKAFSKLDEANEFFQNKEFDKAIEALNISMQLFEEIGWKNEANKIAATIKEYELQKEMYMKKLQEEEKAKKDAVIKLEKKIDDNILKANEAENNNDFDRSIVLLEEALTIVIKSGFDEKRIQIENKIKDVKKAKEKYLAELKSKKEKLASEQKVKQEEAFKLIDQGNIALKKYDFNNALECFQKAKNLLEQIGWLSEAKQLENKILETNQKKEQYIKTVEKDKIKIQMEHEKEQEALNLLDKANIFRVKHKYPEALEAFRKAKEIFEQLGWNAEVNKIENAIIETQNEQERLKELTAKEQKLKKEEDEKKLKAFELLDKAMNLINKYNFLEAIELYKEAQKLFKEIGWNSEAKKLEQTIFETELKYKDYLKLKESGIMEKKKTQEQLEAQALQKLDEGNAYLKEKEYDRALVAYNEAADLFKQLGWKNEIQKVYETIESTKLKQKQFLQEYEKEYGTEKLKQNQLEQKAFSLLDEANILIEKKEFIEAINKLKEAKECFIQLGWNSEAQKIQNTIIDTKNKHKQFINQLKEKEKYEKLNKKKEDLAFKYLDEANALISKNSYEEAIDKLKQAQKLFEEIDWKNEANKIHHQINEVLEKQKQYELSIKKQKELLAKSRKEKQKVAEQKIAYALEQAKNNNFNDALIALNFAYEIYQNLNDNAKITEIEEIINRIKAEQKQYFEKLRREKSKQAEIEKKKRDDAFSYLDIAQEKIKLNLFDEAIEYLKKAKQLFLEINWQSEANKVDESIQKTLKKKEEWMQYKQKTEVEAKTKKELESLAFQNLDKAQNFLKLNQFDEAINHFRKAKELFEKAGWENEANSVAQSILQTEIKKQEFQKKIEQQKYLEELKKKEEEEIRKRIEQEKIKILEEQKKKKQKLEEEKQKEMQAKEISSFAFKMIDEIEKEVQKYKEKIASNDFSMECPYHRAQFTYSEARNMLLEIGWENEANKLIEAINNYKELEKQDQILRENYRKQLQQKQKEEEELRRLIDIKKQQQQEELKKKQLELKKKEEEMQKINTLQNKAFALLEEGTNLTNKRLYDQASAKYEEALKIFNEINWQQGINAVKDAIEYNNALKEKEEAYKKAEKLKEQERLKAQKELEEKIKAAKSEAERKRLEERKKLLEQKQKAEEIKKIGDQIMQMLEEADKLVQNNKFDEGIKKFKETLPLFDKIDWPLKRSQVLEYIQNAEFRKQQYLKMKALKEKQERKAKEEWEKLQQKIAKEQEEMEKIKKEQQSKALRMMLEEEKYEKMKEEAFLELDRGNNALQRHKYQIALNSFNHALELFNKLGGWEKEANMLEKKIADVKKIIQDQFKPKTEIDQEESDLSHKAYKLLDEADLLIRKNKFENALNALNQSKEIFQKIKWDKAVKMVQTKIIQVKKMKDEKAEKLKKLTERKQKRSEEEAYKLLELMENDKRNKRYQQAIEKAEKAQNIFYELGWKKEGSDMTKVIQELKQLYEEQQQIIKKREQKRIEKIKEEETEEERLRRIAEERRRKRRAKRKNL
ncbi:MAG: hypothetical protein ACTSRZ_05975 [Promethearchaeota archaeon]